MINILKVSEKASIQLKKIIDTAPIDTIGIFLGIDKSGCSGYSYKLDFAKKNEVKDLEFVEKDNVKVFIDPKATMFLLGSEMDYITDKGMIFRFLDKRLPICIRTSDFLIIKLLPI